MGIKSKLSLEIFFFNTYKKGSIKFAIRASVEDQRLALYDYMIQGKHTVCTKLKLLKEDHPLLPYSHEYNYLLGSMLNEP